MDPNIAEKWVGENHTQLFTCHLTRNNASTRQIVISIVDTTSVSFMNAVMACLPDPRHKIHDLWGCRGEPDGDGGLRVLNITPIFDDNTAA